MRSEELDTSPVRSPADSTAIAILAVLIAVAAFLRFWKLGEWNFEGTEMFTLRDSVRPQFRNSRPLGYLLNYYLVRPFHPLDELGLRLIPALAGVAAVPTFYLVARRLIGSPGALFGTLFLTLSGLQVYFAQFARYWSLVFLLCAIYPYALYLGARDRRPALLVLGAVTLMLAVLAHPVSAVLAGGPVLWLLWTYARPHYLRRAWSYSGFRWATLAAVVLAVLLSLRLVPLLHNWVTMHDQNPGMGQFLLGPKLAHGPKQMALLLAYLEGLTLPLVLAAGAGLYLLWRRPNRTLAAFLTSLVVFHLGFIALISVRTPVSTFYLLPAAPVFYVGAGVFFDHLSGVDWWVRPRWLAPAMITLAFLLAGMPTLVSQYRNGRRFDFRGVAQWMRPQLSSGDVIFSDQPMVLSHYLDSTAVQKLRHNPAPLADSLSALQAGRGRTLWIVAPAPAHAFRTNLKAGGLAAWMYDNCQLRNTVGRGRLDFRQQYLQVYRCPPSTEPSVRVEEVPETPGWR